MNSTVKEILEEQIKLLSEKSKQNGADIVNLTIAMCRVADLLQEPRRPFRYSGET